MLPSTTQVYERVLGEKFADCAELTTIRELHHNLIFINAALAPLEKGETRQGLLGTQFLQMGFDVGGDGIPSLSAAIVAKVLESEKVEVSLFVLIPEGRRLGSFCLPRILMNPRRLSTR